MTLQSVDQAVDLETVTRAAEAQVFLAAGVFGTALETLMRYQERPLEAGAAAKIETVLREMIDAPGKVWNLTRLCRLTGMSAPTFMKWFKRTTGSAFGPYLRGLRLTRAKEMLSEGNFTMERIALECGLSSSSSFIAFFRKATGSTPRSRWR